MIYEHWLDRTGTRTNAGRHLRSSAGSMRCSKVGKPKTDGRGHLRDNSNVNMEYGGYAIVEYYPEYAPYVELGTWKMAARPYLKPAVEAETDLLTKRIKEELITK